MPRRWAIGNNQASDMESLVFTLNKMNEINLSYVITTYNKLPYLKTVLASLLPNVKPDEEVIVTDGGSKDGTREYLEELLKAGKIHQFISEKDYGEANGWNKAFLMARGILVKDITDDDVFDYREIQKCKEFMLTHSEIDFLGTDGLFAKATLLLQSDYAKEFEHWKSSRKPFAFCGLGWMFRRSSISIFGLLDTSYVSADTEYTLKVTASKANIGWYTGRVWLRTANEQSNSLTQSEKIQKDRDKLRKIYPGSNLDAEKTRNKWHDFIPAPAKSFLRKVKKAVKNDDSTPKITYVPNEKTWEDTYKSQENKLKEWNSKETGKFLFK